MLSGDSSCWKEASIRHAIVDPDLRVILDRVIELTPDEPCVALVVVEVSSLIAAVRKTLFGHKVFLFLLVKNFNRLLSYTFWSTFYRYLNRIAACFKGLRKVKFACIWDPANNRSTRKTEELIRRFATEIIDTAEAYRSNGLKLQKDDLKAFRDREKLAKKYPDLAESGEQETKPVYKPSKIGLVRVELDDVVVPTAPRRIERRKDLSNDEQFVGYGEGDISHYQARGGFEAEHLLPATVSLDYPTRANTPQLDYFTILDGVNRDTFIPSTKDRWLNILDWDIFGIIDERQFPHLFHLVSYHLPMRQQLAIKPCDNPSMLPPSIPSPVSGAAEVWRYFNLETLLHDLTIWACRTIRGRAALHYIIGCDISEGIRNVNLRRFANKLRNFGNFLDNLPLLPAYLALPEPSQLQLENQFRTFMNTLPVDRKRPAFARDLTLGQLLRGQQANMGLAPIGDEIDKRRLYQQEFNIEIGHARIYEEYAHWDRTAMIHQNNSEPSNYVLPFLLPGSTPPTQYPSDQQLAEYRSVPPPSNQHPKQVAPAPRSLNGRPLPFQRDLETAIPAHLQNRSDHCHPGYIDTRPIPTEPPTPPFEITRLAMTRGNFEKFGPAILTERYDLVNAFVRGCIDSLFPDGLPDGLPPKASVAHCLFVSHLGILVTGLPQRERVWRVYQAFLDLVALNKPMLLSTINWNSMEALRSLLQSTGTQIAADSNPPPRQRPKTTGLTDLDRFKRTAATQDREGYDAIDRTKNYSDRLGPSITSRANALHLKLQKDNLQIHDSSPSKNTVLKQILKNPRMVSERIYTTLSKLFDHLPQPLTSPPIVDASVSYLLTLLSNDKSESTLLLLTHLTTFVDVSLSNRSRDPIFDFTFPPTLAPALVSLLERLHQTPRVSGSSERPYPPPISRSDYQRTVNLLLWIFSTIHHANVPLLLRIADNVVRDLPTSESSNRKGPARSATKRNYKEDNGTDEVADEEDDEIIDRLFPPNRSLAETLRGTDSKDARLKEFYWTIRNGFGFMWLYMLGCTDGDYSPNGITFDARLAYFLTAIDGHTKKVPLLTLLEDLLTSQTSIIDKYNEHVRNTGVDSNVKKAPSTARPTKTTTFGHSVEELGLQVIQKEFQRIDHLLSEKGRTFENYLGWTPLQRQLEHQRRYPHLLIPTLLASCPFFKLSEANATLPPGSLAVYTLDVPLVNGTSTVTSTWISKGFADGQNRWETGESLNKAYFETIPRFIKIHRPQAHVPHGRYFMSFFEIQVASFIPNLLDRLPKGTDSVTDFVEGTLYSPSIYEKIKPSGLKVWVPDDSTNSATRRHLEDVPSFLSPPTPDHPVPIWNAARAMKASAPRPKMMLKSSREPKELKLCYSHTFPPSDGPFFNSEELLNNHADKFLYHIESLRYDILADPGPNVSNFLLVNDPGKKYPFATIIIDLSTLDGVSDKLSNNRNAADQSLNSQVSDVLRNLALPTTVLDFADPQSEIGEMMLEGRTEMRAEHRERLAGYLAAYKEENPTHKISEQLEQTVLLRGSYTKERQRVSKSAKQSLVAIQWESFLPRRPGHKNNIIVVLPLKKGLPASRGNHGPSTSGVYMAHSINHLRSLPDCTVKLYSMQEDYTSRTCANCFAPTIMHPTDLRTGYTLYRVSLCEPCKKADHRDVSAARVLSLLVILAVYTRGHYAISPIHFPETAYYGLTPPAGLYPYLVGGAHDSNRAQAYAAAVEQVIAQFPAPENAEPQPAWLATNPPHRGTRAGTPRRRPRVAADPGLDTIDEEELVPEEEVSAEEPEPWWIVDNLLPEQLPHLRQDPSLPYEQMYTQQQRDEWDAYFAKNPGPVDFKEEDLFC